MSWIVTAAMLVLAISVGGVGIPMTGGMIAASVKLACLALVTAVLLVVLTRPRRSCSYPRAYEPWCR